MAPLRRSHRGFLLAEMIVSLIVLATLLLSFGLALQGYKQFNHYQWTRQQCLAAVQAQLDCLTATGSELEAQQAQRLWPRVTLSARRMDGEGQWAGLERYDVTGQASSFHRVVTLNLSRYRAPSEE